MSFPNESTEASNICPHLGLADDADSHATYATEAHRCFQLANPTRIATGHQDSFCLGANHAQCPVFQGEGVEATTAPAAAVPPPLEEAEAQTPTRSSTSEPSGSAGASPSPSPPAGGPPASPPRKPTGSVGGGRPGGGLSMPAATIGLFALAIVVVIVAYFINQQLGKDDGAPSAAAAFAESQTQTALAGGGNTPTTAPDADTPTSQVVVPTATTAAIEEPTATSTTSAGNTYEVQSGDTLGVIAENFGVTVDAIVSANNLADANSIFVGQILTIP